jgi:glycine/sarcosine N-methyltransferase
MNAFYKSLAEWYDVLFPSDPSFVSFVGERVRPEDGNILDIGCGTGSLAAALGGAGYNVTGIDSDAEMIRRSRLKSEGSSNVRFGILDMRDLVQHFSPSAFGCVVCFGNTLVHLTAMEDVAAFLRQVRSVLKDRGSFLLQILHYDHVLDHGINHLPLIENERIRFERTYRTNGNSGLLLFKTVLTIKDSKRILENEIPLLPIRKAELERVILDAGFAGVKWFGDFHGNPLTETSLPLVGAAVR